jgi:MoaA/NifB/PqqE/SkfB family radical SAM enzyme
MGWLKISVDAATKETYEALRTPGKWEDLINALELVSELRASGVFQYVEIKFCCQSRNFREMPAFVEMGEAYGFDQIVLAPIRKWSIPQQEFDEVDLLRKDHPDREEFLRVMESPVLKSPIVKMGEFSTGFIDHDWPWKC